MEVFSDRSLNAEPETIENTLKNAGVFFASFVFDYNQVIWLRERVQNIPIRFRVDEFDSVG